MLVVTVEPPGSPADKGGVREGDVVTGFDDQPINGADDLRGLLTDERVGTRCTLAMLRDGEQLQLDVTPIETPYG